MRKTTLLFVMVAGMGLSACTEGKNPLDKRDSKELAEWIYEKDIPALRVCGKLWMDQSIAPEAALERCESTAENLATSMTEAGFGNVKPDHVKLPTIWMAFNDRVRTSKMNSYDPAKAAEAMKLPTKAENQEKKKRLEEYKKSLRKNDSPTNE